MQVSVELCSVDIERKLNITVPSDSIDKEINKRLKETGKDLQIPGFRRGKIPHGMLLRRFGSGVASEYLSEAMPSIINEAAKSEGLITVGILSLKSQPYVLGKNFNFEAVVELYPDISDEVYEGINLTMPVAEITEDVVEETIQNIRWGSSESVVYEGEIEDRDIVTFSNRSQPVNEFGFSYSDKEGEIVMGDKQVTAEFEETLLGMKTGETREVDVILTEAYHGPLFAGQKVRFTVTADKVKRKVLVDLDDDFAMKFGVEEGGMETMRKHITASLHHELEDRDYVIARERIMDALYGNNKNTKKVTLPKTMVSNMLEQRRQKAMGLVYDPERPVGSIFEDELETPIAENCRRELLYTLVSAHIAHKFDLVVHEEKVDEELLKMADSYTDPNKAFAEIRGNAKSVRKLEGEIMDKLVIKKIMEAATVTNEKISFMELTKLKEVTQSFGYI